MSFALRQTALSWAAIAALLFVGTFAGKEAGIVAYWGNLLWTMPFGVIFLDVLSQSLHAHLSGGVAYRVALMIVDIAAGAFWFLIFPRIYRAIANLGAP